MPYEEESWLEVAKVLGFDTEEEMLKNMYVFQNFSYKQIGKTLGYNPWTVRVRLQRMGVEPRGRGGANNPKGRKLQALADEELFHSEVLDLVKRYDIHPSTVSSERRFRKKMKEGKMEVVV